MTVWMLIKLVILTLICAIAVFTDIKKRKVYNWLTFPAILFGLGINLLEYGLSGSLVSLAGGLAGGMPFFLFFMFGAMGAGDVKLMVAIGSIMGWEFALNTVLYAAISGGVLAVVYLIVKGRLIVTLINTLRFLRSLIMPRLVTESLSDKNSFPYAVAIVTGVAATFFLPPLI